MRPAAVHPPPLNIRRSQAPQIPSSSDVLYREIYNMTPPTPGMDDGQHFRFAIEQLTRDEELLGRARQGSIDGQGNPSNYVVPKESFAHQESSTSSRKAAPSMLQSSGPTIAPEPLANSHPNTSPSSLLSPKGNDAPTSTASILPNRHPEEGAARPVPPSPRCKPNRAASRPTEVLRPVTPAQQDLASSMGYLPWALRPASLSLFALFCVFFMIVLIVCNILSLQRDGLYNYDGTGTRTYFIFQFLPPLLGVVLLYHMFVLQAAVYRTIPFVSMSTGSRSHLILHEMSMIPTNFLIPDLRYFTWREPAVGASLLIFWISYFTVPLLSCIFQTTPVQSEGEFQWRWTTVQDVVWVLMCMYIILLGAIVMLASRFRSGRSALRWDPVSLADLMILFQQTNTTADFEGSEIWESTKACARRALVRLGFWIGSDSSSMFHAIGEVNAPANQSARVAELDKEKSLSVDGSSFNLNYQRYSHAESFTRNIHSPFFRYRWAPWFLRNTAMVIWILLAVTLYAVFLIVSFVNQAVERGFPPGIPTTTDSRGFSPSNFFYSFVPSLLAMVLVLAWQPIDAYFRAVQPFANLSTSPDGATAPRSLLLSYGHRWPFETTVRAVYHGDYKVAYVSFISILSAALPILSGGVFSGQYFTQQIEQPEVRIVATMPAYRALCFFLAIYAFSFCVIWPKRKRYLPHPISTLADYFSFFYHSSLLGDPTLSTGVRSKRDFMRRLTSTEEARFCFGVYIGNDGKEHLGIDRLDGRRGSDRGGSDRIGGSPRYTSGSGGKNGSTRGADGIGIAV